MKDLDLEFKKIKMDLIDPNPENSKLFSMDNIDHLASIIEEEGFSTPIEVFKKENGRYEITSGHRRYEAMKLLGNKEIPCYITPAYKEKTKKDRKLLSSNIAARRLTPLEMAYAISLYKQILEKEKYKGNKRLKVAQYFNISESNVHRYECLLKLIPELQEYCKKPLFPYSSLSKAATLTEEEQYKLYEELIRIEAKTKNIDDNEVEKDEIIFSRTRIEQIIQNKIRNKKEEIKKPDKQEIIEDEFLEPFPMNQPIQIIRDEDDTIINIEESHPLEIIKTNESYDSPELNLAGLTQCISIIREYSKTKINSNKKKEIIKIVTDIKEELEKLEKNL